MVTYNRCKTWESNRLPAKLKQNRPNRPEDHKMSVSSRSTGGRPTYTERQIKDEHVGVEMFLVFTVISSREVGCGGTPRVRVDGLTIVSDVEWDRRFSGPEPNLDTILFATGEGVESASDCVEIFAVRIRGANPSSTTLVEVEVGVTVRRCGLSASTPISHQRRRRAEEGGTRPSCHLSSGIVHPGRVCSEIKFWSASFTPCRMHVSAQ